MLESYVEKAELKDGMRIFDMGCEYNIDDDFAPDI